MANFGMPATAMPTPPTSPPRKSKTSTRLVVPYTGSETLNVTRVLMTVLLRTRNVNECTSTTSPTNITSASVTRSSKVTGKYEVASTETEANQATSTQGSQRRILSVIGMKAS